MATVLTPNWRAIVARSWAQWCAYLGLVLPEILDFTLQWLTSDAANKLDPETKNLLRAGALLGVILTRPLRQKSLPPTGDAR